MKQYFKYEYGYVNIDEENIYLTTSGNWTEIHELNEKTGKTKAGNTLRRYSNIAFFATIAIGLTLGFFRTLIFKNTGILGLLLAPLGIFYLYKYLRRDFGVKYKIPLKKIQTFEFEPEERKIIIHFTNGNNNIDSEILTKVDNKDFEVLQSTQSK